MSNAEAPHSDPREDRAHAPVYRYEGPEVRQFKGWPLVILIGGAVLAGASFMAALPSILAAFDDPDAPFQPPPAPVVTRAGIEGVLELKGPDGPVAIPQHQPILLHVWLQGCTDCMDAFAAHKELMASELYAQLPHINVGYRRADKAWAQEWKVDRGLAVDPGDKLVGPLGIGTFTTFLVTPDGKFHFRGRPALEGDDGEGFARKIAAKLKEL